VLSLFFCIVLTWADGPIVQARVFNLGEVVFTGKGETITQVSTVETVDKESLDLTNATDVSKALEALPGVAVSAGTRNEAYLNVRGFNQRYVPIFYDGIPLYIPNDGYVDSSELSTGNISQITLTKGAASVLYGPNTMGGVINIVSTKPQKPFELSYNFDAGENGHNGSLNIGSKLNRFYFAGGVSHLYSDGFKMSNNFEPIPAAGWFEDGDTRDNSDMKSLSGSFKIGFEPAEGHEYAIGVQRVNSERGLPPTIYTAERQRFWRFTDWEKATYYFIGDSRITDTLSAKTRIYHDTYYNVLDSYDDSTYTTQNLGFAFHSTYDDHTNGGSLVLRSTCINRNTLSFAFHYKEDVHKEQDDYNTVWERYEGKTFSYGLEDDIKINKNLATVLGVSYDIQSPEYANGGALRGDDKAWNGQGGLVYNFEDETKLHASVAKKTRFPTLNELYSSYLGTATPNPSLKKEQSMNYEVGVERPLCEDSYGGLSVFYSDVSDLIVRTRTGAIDFWDNIGKAQYKGAELNFKTKFFSRNDINLNYTYLEAEDKSASPQPHLSESPKHQIYISDLIKINELVSLFAKAEYRSGQWEQKRDNTWIELDDYWTMDLKVMAEFSEKATLEFGVQNIFDENYDTSYGFPREGRSFFFGIRGNL
jgi:iron complex outermembrane receptor protein